MKKNSSSHHPNETSGLGCPSAMCTDGHPYAWTWCSLWTNCD